MEQKERRDFVVAGRANTSGGEFDRVSIHGDGHVDGDLVCTELKCHGKSHITGNVKASDVKVYGSTRIDGRVESEELQVRGHGEIGGHLSCRKMEAEGMLHVGGPLTAEEVTLKGHLNAKEDVEAESFSAKGAFTIDGLLNAGQVGVQLYGNCRVKEIGGEKIEVRKKGFSFWFKPFSHHLEVETIEGDEIHLEYTRAKVVRGNRVTIGPGCEIGLVEYHDHFHRDDDAKVKESKKL
jgi:cytoskeletal protein CcmA (bactofilin family)